MREVLIHVTEAFMLERCPFQRGVRVLASCLC